ncbi:MAG: F0F1 ATP synthase subunit gamma [Clostridium sp.]|jgi:F-type H+-transporting ATPase subunit gamma|uniref:ATP synthase F1 subunit gamma n=1 Tax=Clostridium sp. TaxID=1506 RepID=UPI0025BC57EF|nr:ATP synthase F1 subunit gamma [Clostridium sp.]MCH3965287.1 F0F1 ATP synthase subunit gamma [Clostridium sp.]MCI1714508.1 F0F1 ATP synthase subunit gamma [Clostridium sp.]MCI1798770.1 F0F1 ATP synthase subunit gamma [Clostridium sp.]MCI1812499.1 F0F1 ATP synthase subunit gamma [Clostridium sp.]MCI1869580.1 F0F1 ATP synthase subunit gamma [Clostridium sp.]
MAGAGLVAIKRRIKSITSTQKITNAMSLIATANLRKVRKKLEINNTYSKLFSDIVQKIASEDWDGSIYTNGNKSNKKLYICLNSDTGLCGGFNNNVVSGLDAEISKDRENCVLIAVGQKGRMYFKKLHYVTEAEYVDISDVPTVREASTIVYKVFDLYKSGKVGEINIAYTKFISTIKQEVIVEKLLPIKADRENQNFVKVEPGVAEIIEDTVFLHLKQKVLNCMMNSKASEQASRMTAMDGSTKNANDLLESLNLKYNRERQTAITQEITEIVGGAEALK